MANDMLDQAKRGEEAYKTHCSECHGGDLMGDGFAPSLAGADFQGNWNDLSVGDLGLFASYVPVLASLPRWAGRLGAYHRQAEVSVGRLAELRLDRALQFLADAAVL